VYASGINISLDFVEY